MQASAEGLLDVLSHGGRPTSKEANGTELNLLLYKGINPSYEGRVLINGISTLVKEAEGAYSPLPLYENTQK